MNQPFRIACRVGEVSAPWRSSPFPADAWFTGNRWRMFDTLSDAAEEALLESHGAIVMEYGVCDADLNLVWTLDHGEQGRSKLASGARAAAGVVEESVIELARSGA